MEGTSFSIGGEFGVPINSMTMGIEAVLLSLVTSKLPNIRAHNFRQMTVSSTSTFLGPYAKVFVGVLLN